MRVCGYDRVGGPPEIVGVSVSDAVDALSWFLQAKRSGDDGPSGAGV